MITSYEVGSIFKVVDMATPELRKISAVLGTVGSELSKIKSELASLGKMKFSGTYEALKGLDLQFAKVGEASALAKTAVLENFAKADTGIGATIKEVGRLNTMLAETKTAMKGMRAPAGAGGGGRRGMGHGGGLGFGGDHMALAIGGAFTAGGIIHGMVDAGKDAAEFQHVQEQMRQAGFSASDIGKATAASWNVGGKLGMSVTDIMRDVKEIRQPFGSVEEVLKFIEPLERMKVVLNAVSEGKGTSSRDAVYEMVRAGELKGLNDPSEYMRYFEDMTRVISATGGKVGPKEFMQATKYSRLAALGYNEEFYTKYLPTLIQGLGASGAGTAGAALFGTMVQGKATARAVGEMDTLGLIGDRSRLRYDKHGNPIGFSSGAIKDTDKLMQNPFQWVKEDLLPMIEKKYGDVTTDKGRTAAVKALGDIFGNRMSAQDAGEFLLRMKSFDRDAKLNAGALGIGGAEALQAKDPTAAWSKLVGSFTNFMTALGEPLIGPAVKCMNMLSDGLKAVTDWARAHPDAVRNLAAGLAGAATLLGAAAVGSAAVLLGTGGAVTVAIATIAGAITGLAALNWKALADGLSSFWEKVKGFLPQFTPAVPKDGGATFLEQSYQGTGANAGLLRNISFGGANDNLPAGIVNTNGGIINIIASGANAGLDGSSGAGLIRASYGGGGGGGGSGFNDTSGGGGDRYGGYSGGGGKGRGNFSGAEMSRAQHAMGILTKIGWTPEAAASLVSQGMEESNLTPNGPAGDHGTAHGMFQWRFERFAALKAFAAKLGTPWTNFDTQVLFAAHEAKMKGLGAWANTHSLYQGGRYGKAFEGYGTNTFGDRYRNSETVLRAYRQGGSVAVGPPPAKDTHIHIHNKTHLDGKIVAENTAHHRSNNLRFPLSIGDPDSRGHWMNPSTPFTDVA